MTTPAIVISGDFMSDMGAERFPHMVRYARCYNARPPWDTLYRIDHLSCQRPVDDAESYQSLVIGSQTSSRCTFVCEDCASKLSARAKSRDASNDR